MNESPNADRPVQVARTGRLARRPLAKKRMKKRGATKKRRTKPGDSVQGGASRKQNDTSSNNWSRDEKKRAANAQFRTTNQGAFGPQPFLQSNRERQTIEGAAMSSAHVETCRKE